MFFSGGHYDGYRVRWCKTLTPHTGNDRMTKCGYGKASTRQLHSKAHCCFWSGHTRKQSNALAAVIHKQESRHKVPKSAVRAVLGRMRFTLHATRRAPHGASSLVQAMSVWSVKTRRARPRHSRDARVYGRMATATHKLSTPPPPTRSIAEIDRESAMYARKWRETVNSEKCAVVVCNQDKGESGKFQMEMGRR